LKLSGNAAPARRVCADGRTRGGHAAGEGPAAALRSTPRRGASRSSTPFESLGAPPPNKIMRLPFGEEVAAIYQLVALVLRSKTASEATIKAAKAADKAASIVEEAIVPIAKLEHRRYQARGFRTAPIRRAPIRRAGACGLRDRRCAKEGFARVVRDNGLPHVIGSFAEVPRRSSSVDCTSSALRPARSDAPDARHRILNDVADDREAVAA
jgi:hypothetical protein